MTLFIDDLVKAYAEAEKALLEATDALKEREMAVYASLAGEFAGVSDAADRAILNRAILEDSEIRRLTTDARRCRSEHIDARAELDSATLHLRQREVEAHEANMRFIERSRS